MTLCVLYIYIYMYVCIYIYILGHTFSSLIVPVVVLVVLVVVLVVLVVRRGRGSSVVWLFCFFLRYPFSCHVARPIHSNIGA